MSPDEIEAIVKVLVTICWVPSVFFLLIHGEAYLRAERRTIPGTAVLVMAGVIFILMTLAFLTRVLEVVLPEWVRGVSFALVAIGVWWKLIALLRVRYGQSTEDDDRIGVHDAR